MSSVTNDPILDGGRYVADRAKITNIPLALIKNVQCLYIHNPSSDRP